MVPDFTWPLYVQKQPLIDFQCSSKENYLYLSKKTIKMLLFLTTYLHEARYSSYTSIKTDVTESMQKSEENPAILQ